MKLEYYFSNSARSYTVIAKGDDGQIETLQLADECTAADVRNLLETALNADYTELETATDEESLSSAIIATFTEGDEETRKLYELDQEFTAAEIEEFFNLVMQMQAADETATTTDKN